MPTYEYLCSSCGNAWEEIQKITEPALEICPACKKATAKRQISGGNFILKGGGWYSDLYSSPKAAPAKDDSSGKSGEGGGDKGGANDSKGETKSEPKSESTDSKKTGGTGASGASASSTTPSKAAAE